MKNINIIIQLIREMGMLNSAYCANSIVSIGNGSIVDEAEYKASIRKQFSIRKQDLYTYLKEAGYDLIIKGANIMDVKKMINKIYNASKKVHMDGAEALIAEIEDKFNSIQVKVVELLN